MGRDSNVAEERAEQDAEERVPGGRADAKTRGLFEELRPRAVAALRVDAVEDGIARPEHGVLGDRAADALLTPRPPSARTGGRSRAAAATCVTRFAAGSSGRA